MRIKRLAIVPNVLVVAMSVLATAGRAHATTTGPAAAAVAEARHGLPPGLLTAIGSVESGSWGPSVNGNDGTPGRRFATTDDAVRYTASLLGSGSTMVDVGCFQVDLRYHPDAFQHWQDGFDGTLNAEAAAGILTELHLRSGSWDRAVALYHSADQERGQAYLQTVLDTWRRDPSVTSFGSRYGDKVAFRSDVIRVAVWGPGVTTGSDGTQRFRHAGLPAVITP